MQFVEQPSEFPHVLLLSAELAFPFRPLHRDQTPISFQAGSREKDKIRDRGESPGDDHIKAFAEATPPGQLLDTQMQGETVIKPQVAHNMSLKVDFFTYGIHRHHLPGGIGEGQGQPGETTPRADIEKALTGVQKRQDRKGVNQMLNNHLFQHVDGGQINLLVPAQQFLTEPEKAFADFRRELQFQRTQTALQKRAPIIHDATTH